MYLYSYYHLALFFIHEKIMLILFFLFYRKRIVFVKYKIIAVIFNLTRTNMADRLSSCCRGNGTQTHISLRTSDVFQVCSQVRQKNDFLWFQIQKQTEGESVREVYCNERLLNYRCHRSSVSYMSSVSFNSFVSYINY